LVEVAFFAVEVVVFLVEVAFFAVEVVAFLAVVVVVVFGL
jgi:hypothetical protein